MQGSNDSQRRPTTGDATRARTTANCPDRSDDELLQLPQMSEITTLEVATLRWLRHNGEGPPMFKLGRRLVCWKSDLLRWIEERAAADARARS